MVPLLVCGTDRNATAKKEMVVSGMQEEIRQRVMTMSLVLRSCLGGSRPFWCPQYGHTRVFEYTQGLKNQGVSPCYGASTRRPWTLGLLQT